MDPSPTDLPEEVIEVILSKCPVKSVTRFKSVCKPWLSIISGPRFSKIHRIQQSKLSENQNKFLLWARPLSDLTKLTRIYLIRLENGKFLRESVFPYQSLTYVLRTCSCNGLFLLRADPNNHQYLLWNPSIRKHIMIRGLTPQTDPDHAFKPGACPHPRLRHFYYDAIADDHKIVFVYEDCYTVYSCRNGSWAEMKDLPCELSLIYRGASMDGCFYGLSNGKVVCFDARDGNLHKFRQPNDVKCVVDIWNVSDRVCLYGLSEDETKLQLWVMEKHGSFETKWCFSWRKLISMEKQEADLWLLTPIYLSNEDEVVLYARVGQRRGLKHFIYNPRRNNFRRINVHWKYFSQFHPYSENLFMPSSNI